MASVTLLRSDMSEPLTVEVRSQERRTLLNVLRQLKLFDSETCERQCCGQCAVKVAPRPRGAGPRPVRLDAHEKSVLFKAGKLSREQYEAQLVSGSPSLWRLACWYVLRYEEIIVAVQMRSAP